MKLAGFTSIGVRGKDSVCFVTQKKVPDKLVDPTSVTHLFKVTKHVGMLTTGRIADCKSLVTKARQEAAEFQSPDAGHGAALTVCDRGSGSMRAQTGAQVRERLVRGSRGLPRFPYTAGHVLGVDHTSSRSPVCHRLGGRDES